MPRYPADLGGNGIDGYIRILFFCWFGLGIRVGIGRWADGWAWDELALELIETAPILRLVLRAPGLSGLSLPELIDSI
jgi:hypothetical protein